MGKSKSKGKHPLLTLCIIGGILVFTVYIIVFIEIDGINLKDIIMGKHNIREYDIFKDKGTQIVQLEPQQNTNDQQQSNPIQLEPSSPSQFNLANSDGYFEMFEHIHTSDFDDLSPTLQTRHLHELFRFKVMEFIHKRQKEGNKKQPGQGDLLELMYRIYRNHDTGVNFIQVGACDGDFSNSNDPIQKYILSKRDWHGVMLEPVPYLFERLKGNIDRHIKDWEDRIVPINAALSDRDGIQTFYVVNPHFAEEMPNESHALKHQIGSFNKQHIVKHLKIKKERKQLSQELDYYIDGINVTAMAAPSVVRRYKESGKVVRDGHIDVLTIDAEGYDYIVLKGFLANTTIRPLMVIYEHLHLTNEDKQNAISLLHEYGYIDIDDWWNTIGIRSSNLR